MQNAAALLAVVAVLVALLRRPASAALSNVRIIHRINQLERTMTKQFDDIKAALDILRNAVAEVEGELTELAAAVTAGKDDPEAMEAVAGDITALAARLHDAYSPPSAPPVEEPPAEPPVGEPV